MRLLIFYKNDKKEKIPRIKKALLANEIVESNFSIKLV